MASNNPLFEATKNMKIGKAKLVQAAKVSDKTPIISTNSLSNPAEVFSKIQRRDPLKTSSSSCSTSIINDTSSLSISNTESLSNMTKYKDTGKPNMKDSVPSIIAPVFGTKQTTEKITTLSFEAVGIKPPPILTADMLSNNSHSEANTKKRKTKSLASSTKITAAQDTLIQEFGHHPVDKQVQKTEKKAVKQAQKKAKPGTIVLDDPPVFVEDQTQFPTEVSLDNESIDKDIETSKDQVINIEEEDSMPNFFSSFDTQNKGKQEEDEAEQPQNFYSLFQGETQIPKKVERVFKFLEFDDGLPDEDYSELSDEWTVKYAPKMAQEVFGSKANKQKIQEIRNWLQDYKNRKFSAGFTMGIVISGPVGCGKTSLVYALANEFGYDVEEITPDTNKDDETRSITVALKGVNIQNKPKTFVEARIVTELQRKRPPWENPKIILVDQADSANNIDGLINRDTVYEPIAKLLRPKFETSDKGRHKEVPVDDPTGVVTSTFVEQPIEWPPPVIFTVNDHSSKCIKTLTVPYTLLKKGQHGKQPKGKAAKESLKADKKGDTKYQYTPCSKFILYKLPPSDLQNLIFKICRAEKIQPRKIDLIVACANGDARKAVFLLQQCCGQLGSNNEMLESFVETTCRVLGGSECFSLPAFKQAESMLAERKDSKRLMFDAAQSTSMVQILLYHNTHTSLKMNFQQEAILIESDKKTYTNSKALHPYTKAYLGEASKPPNQSKKSQIISAAQLDAFSKISDSWSIADTYDADGAWKLRGDNTDVVDLGTYRNLFRFAIPCISSRYPNQRSQLYNFKKQGSWESTIVMPDMGQEYRVMSQTNATMCKNYKLSPSCFFAPSITVYEYAIYLDALINSIWNNIKALEALVNNTTSRVSKKSISFAIKLEKENVGKFDTKALWFKDFAKQIIPKIDIILPKLESIRSGREILDILSNNTSIVRLLLANPKSKSTYIQLVESYADYIDPNKGRTYLNNITFQSKTISTLSGHDVDVDLSALVINESSYYFENFDTMYRILDKDISETESLKAKTQRRSTKKTVDLNDLEDYDKLDSLKERFASLLVCSGLTSELIKSIQKQSKFPGIAGKSFDNWGEARQHKKRILLALPERMKKLRSVLASQGFKFS